MNILALVICFLFFTPGSANAIDVFADGWIPTGIVENGKVMILDQEGQPLPALEGMSPGIRIYPNGLEFTAITNSEGQLVERQLNEKKFFQVQRVINGVPYRMWLEKDQNDFLFTRPSNNASAPTTATSAVDPICKKWNTSSSLLAGSETRVYKNSSQVGPGTNSPTELAVKLGAPDCSQDWMPGCVQDPRKGWVPVWLWSSKVRTCMDTATEAGSSDSRCVDCQTGDIQSQAARLNQMAIQARTRANADLVKYVPKDIHALATQTALECRNFANYRYQDMDKDSFLNYMSLANSSPGPGKTQADVNACASIVQSCGRNDSCDYSVCHGILRTCNQPGLFKGWCLRGVRETLIDAGMIPKVSSIGGRPTDPTTATNLKSYGFKNMIDQFKTDTPPGFHNLPPGAVILYNDPNGISQAGHAEVFTGASYCSDFCSTRPISEYRWEGRSQRRPIGIYIKTRKH